MNFRPKTPREGGPLAQRIAELQDKAKGQWAFIFEDLAEPLREAVTNAPYHVACPVHGGTDGYRLFPHFNDTGQGICNTCGGRTSGASTLAWARQIPLEQAVREIEQWLRLEHNTAARPARQLPAFKPAVDPAQAYKRIAQVWKASRPIEGTPAEKYLLKRGIWRANFAPVLRFHPGLSYIHGKEKRNYGKFPCLLAPIKDRNGKMVSIHRIFLTEDGDKAPVPDPKKMMSAQADIRGAAIRLFPAGDVLGVAEGIETALAAHAVSRIPVWSCVSAVLMELVDIPDTVKTVVVWADLDRSCRGAEAAERLADRLEKQGKQVQICLPQGPIPADAKGLDWLDVMTTVGLNGFPARFRRWRPEMTQ